MDLINRIWRFGMELHDVSDVVRNCGFSVFTSALENGGSVRGINAEGQGAMPRKKIDKLVELPKDTVPKAWHILPLQKMAQENLLCKIYDRRRDGCNSGCYGW